MRRVRRGVLVLNTPEIAHQVQITEILRSVGIALRLQRVLDDGTCRGHVGIQLCVQLRSVMDTRRDRFRPHESRRNTHDKLNGPHEFLKGGEPPKVLLRFVLYLRAQGRSDIIEALALRVWPVLQEAVNQAFLRFIGDVVWKLPARRAALRSVLHAKPQSITNTHSLMTCVTSASVIGPVGYDLKPFGGSPNWSRSATGRYTANSAGSGTGSSFRPGLKSGAVDRSVRSNMRKRRLHSCTNDLSLPSPWMAARMVSQNSTTHRMTSAVASDVSICGSASRSARHAASCSAAAMRMAGSLWQTRE